MFDMGLHLQVKELREYCVALYHILEDNDLITASQFAEYLERAKAEVKEADDAVSAQVGGVRIC